MEMTQPQIDNPYSKLEEVLRVFLNPTLDLIRADVEDLSQHCYYLINNKFPKHEHPVWDYLINRDWDALTKLESPDIDLKLVSNLKLANSKKDEDYLQYLLEHQPHRKLVLNLSRKKAILDEDLAEPFEIENPKLLTSVCLKRKINWYIAQHRLQERSLVKLDEILCRTLGYESAKAGTLVHLFEIHRTFNQKYLT